MTRPKVKLAYIVNDSTRKATYKKRKRGLLKKIGELATLCDVQACAVIYSPYHAHLPEVWPSPLVAQGIYQQLKALPETDQTKKMMSQESYLRHRIEKANEKLEKLKRDNHEKEMRNVMFDCLTGKPLEGIIFPDLKDMGLLIERSLRDIINIIERRKEELPDQFLAPSTHAGPSATAVTVAGRGMVLPQNEDRFLASPTLVGPSGASAVTVSAAAGPGMVPRSGYESMEMEMESYAPESNMENILRPPWLVGDETKNLNTEEHLEFTHPAWEEALKFADPNDNARWSKNQFLP